jgi:hypothetical protein
VAPPSPPCDVIPERAGRDEVAEVDVVDARQGSHGFTGSAAKNASHDSVVTS